MQRFLTYLRIYSSYIYKGFLFLSSIILLLIIFPKEGKFKYEFQKGRPWMHADLIASYDFAILKPESEIETERNNILSQVKPYYIFDENIVTQKKEELLNLFERNWSDKYEENRTTNKHKKLNREFCEQIFDTLALQGIYENYQNMEPALSANKIILIRANVAGEKKREAVFTIQLAHEYIKLRVSKAEGLDGDLLLSTLENSLFRNVRYDQEKTLSEKQKALDEISLTRGMVQAGERIISKGELVTPEKYLILESMRREYEQQLGSPAAYYMILIGLFILISISIVVLFFFLMYFRSDIFFSNKKIALILLLIILMVYITSLVVKYNADYLYIVPICIIPIIVRAFFKTRPALYIHIITIIIIGFLVPNSFEFIFSQLIAGIIAIISVLHLQRRAQFFMTSMMIFFTYSAVYVGLSLIQEGSFEGLDWKYFLLFAGSAILTLFSYPLIYIFEKIFGLITDVTLMELSNTNSRLLRELSSKAPGTFQHSMQVANLAEEIIYEIGGNTLLARTGALYHDIGKMDNPVYFTENQQAESHVNPHDNLDPDESAKIIINHITKGVELARKYSLPQQITDFIRTHQGNRKAEYFYAMKKKNTPAERIDESIYTYPGPIPMSRETAIVMMADSVEAASRSLKTIDEESISELVEYIIDRQIDEKQFINSNITFREITKIKNVLKKQLLNIYHVRVEYPK